MLWFVGVGVGGYKGISLEGVDVLKKCDTVFVEQFTSALSEQDIRDLGSLIGRELRIVQRWFVEDGREILEAAKGREVAIVTYGDPLMATTHNELRQRAEKNSIKTSVVHSASGLSSAIGEVGLHAYKFGRMVTMMSEPQSAISVYGTVFENLLAGNHTLVLTEYRFEGTGEPFFLDPKNVFESLLQVEADQKHHAISGDTFAVVASRIGERSQGIVSGKIRSLMTGDFGKGPHSIIITGSMHFTEADAVKSITRNLDEPADNSKGVTKIAVQMVTQYAPKARIALKNMREFLRNEGAQNNRGSFEVLDNAEYYLADAERFLNQGKHDLAVLSVGYAEGLVDALRFQKGINPWLPPN